MVAPYNYSNQKPSSADHMEFSWACQLSMCALVEDSLLLESIALAQLISLYSLCYLGYRIALQAAKKTVADSFVFSEVASLATPFKVMKLCNQCLSIQFRGNTELNMYCKISTLSFQPMRSSACEQSEKAPKVQMPRWNAAISHTQ